MTHHVRQTKFKFPREPVGMTPAGAVCSTCSQGLDSHTGDHTRIPIQMPCGCVFHFACIDLWFGCQLSPRYWSEGGLASLTCWNCEAFVDMEPLGFNTNHEELYHESVWNPHKEVMIIVVSVIEASRPTVECVDPRNTTYRNPYTL